MIYNKDMNGTNGFGQILKEAIKTQNRRDIDRLTRDAAFLQLTAEELNAALLECGPLMQDPELLPRFIIHPNFKNISTAAFAKTMMLAIPLPYGNEIQALLNHPQLEKITPHVAEEMVQAFCQFQDRRIISDLSYTALFKPLFDRHLPEMALCAIRTQNVNWLREILNNPKYKGFSEKAFPYLIRWALNKRDQNITTLAIRTLHFIPETEKLLSQELVDTFNNEVDELAEAVVDELVSHPDFLSLTHTLVSWMLMMAIIYIDQELFQMLITHKSYPDIPTSRLAELMVFAMSSEKNMLDQLTLHPHFAHFSGAELGLLLETTQSENKEFVFVLLKHPHFEQIPEDHFHRMQIMHDKTTTQDFRNTFLNDPLFKKKYGEMLYEAIRRDECEFLAGLLKDKTIKKMILAQLQNYALTDSFFVSEYTIRDMMREVFLTRDQPLVMEMISNPLFEKRIPALSAQAIQFDDEELIESLIDNPRSQMIFHEVIEAAPQEDRERINRLRERSRKDKGQGR